MSKKKMTGREVLEEALRQCCSSYCDQYPRYEGEIDLGDDYGVYMDKLVKRSKHPIWYYIRKIGKMAAMFALVLGVVLGVTVTSYGERKFTADLYVQPHIVRPNHMIYRFSYPSEGAPKKLNELFELTYVPENYTLTERKLDFYGRYLVYRYENEKGDCIIFEQETISHGIGFDLDKTEVEILQIQDLDVVYAKSNSRTTLFWGNYGYAFQLTFYDQISWDEIMKIFNSIQKVRE